MTPSVLHEGCPKKRSLLGIPSMEGFGVIFALYETDV
jgi:hypothetical protein